jgi:hypothetical protein
MRKDASSGSDPDDYFGLVLYPSDGNAASLFIGDTGETDFYSLGEAGSAQGQYASGVTSAVSSAATLLVVKITFQAGADKVELYVNPDPSAPAPATAAATKSDLDIADINEIGIIAGLDAVWSADEIRIGRSFADVAPLPPIRVASLGKASGVVSGTGVGLPLKTHTVQFTDNLAQQFTFLKTTNANGSGVFQFQDTPPGAKRFYRVTYP